MLIGIDASRATAARRTGTETYSLQLIRALLRLGSGHRFRLYTNGPPPVGLFEDEESPQLQGHQPHLEGPSAPPLPTVKGASAPTRDLVPLTMGNSALHGTEWGSKGLEVRSIPFPRLWTHIRLSAEVMAHPPDVLFVPAHVLPLMHPRQSVATVHDLGFLVYPDAHRAVDRRYLAWSTGWNARKAMAVVADSQATKADLLREYEVAASKVHVIYLGRDETLRPVQDPSALESVRARCGITGQYLLYVGTLQPRKNLSRLVEAFSRLADAPSVADVQLVLAGKRGWLFDDLFARVERSGLAGRVLFPGYVEDDDLPALLSGARAFVYPSLYEGFGIPVLEAQACGAPVMTSNNSSLPEVAGDAAVLVDPHDVDAIAAAMHRLATDDALRAELVRRGFENVKRFSWEKCARETLAVLESAAKRSREQRGTMPRTDRAASGSK